MIPTFEADVALKYNPYPDPKYDIHFDDVFWHLNRETMQESFCRILARQRFSLFSGLRDLLRSLFDKVDEAIEHVAKCETLDELFKEVNVVIITETPERRAEFTGRYNANSYPEIGQLVMPQKIGHFEEYGSRKIRLFNDAQTVLSDAYVEFIAALKEARQQQRQPDKW